MTYKMAMQKTIPKNDYATDSNIGNLQQDYKY